MKLAIVFPGQGSQSVGMLRQLYDAYAEVRNVVDEACDVLDYDLWEIINSGPKEKLDRTLITQPAMLCAGVAVYRVLSLELDIKPSVMAGHSLGEYTALTCSSALDFSDAVKLVSARGRLMREAVAENHGAMAAILGLDDEKIISICAQMTGTVEAVNFNAPGQVVIAGEKEPVNRACTAAKKAGAKRALILPVSVPSHSSLMKPAADKFSTIIAELMINPPEIPVINNVNCKAEIEPELIRGALVRQLYRPVRWVDIVRAMKQKGISHIIESGPGKVLTGLIKRIEKELKTMAVFDIKTLTAVKENMK